MKQNKNHPQQAHFLNPLNKPVYVIRMNWWHWSDKNRANWLWNLREALDETLRHVDAELLRLGMPPRR